jgi:pimeloyl-ACP methyl ester carboxylesterase
VPDRGEFFVRRHVHPDADVPTVLLLHGWTASADLQFMAAYRALGEHFSFVGIDHRGHGRGFRSTVAFDLDDVADDAAAVAAQLGISSVIAVGYSMGGPVSLHLARRHPRLVSGLVVQATALEWRERWSERVLWRLLPAMGVLLRSWTQPRLLRRGVEYVVTDSSPYAPYRAWMIAETMRNEPRVMVQAGRALSNYDARPWAATLDVPSAALISTKDRLVKPRKQRELAAALRASIVELPMDHLGAIEMPDQFASATVALVSSVAAAVGATPAPAEVRVSESI